jgi:hypothetical protein
MNTVPIIADITDISSQFNFTREQSDKFMSAVLSNIVDTFMYEWNEEVKNSSLRSSKSGYMDAMYVKEVSKNAYEVGLHGWLPIAIELGISAFDEKEGFFKSTKAKVGKDGKKYFTIPFKQATPDAVATASTFSGKMPKDIYNIIKKKGGDVPTIRLNDLPDEYKILGSRKEVETFTGETKPEYIHKSPIFEGLTKSTLPQHSGYVTFRRASENNLDAFIHTGIQARNLMGNTLDRFGESVMSGVVDSALENFIE